MLKAISGVSLRSSGLVIRPLVNACANAKFSPIVKIESAKYQFHTTAMKLGGGDHEFVVSICQELISTVLF